MSRQALFTYHAIKQSLPSASDTFTKDYSALKEDVKKLEAEIVKIKESHVTQYGEGSPEGIIVANNTMLYFDITNSPTAIIQYFNSNVGSDTGWVIVA